MVKNQSCKASGFTLIELVVTAAFVASVAVSVSEIFITIGKIDSQARNLATATELAQQKMETDRNAGYGAIPASEDFSNVLPANFGSPKSATATFNDLSPADPGIKELDIAINYLDRGTTKNVRISSLIAQKGIDR